MRVVSGSLGGRHFESPHGQRTHPMSEKARGAIFNALGDIEGLRVLDAYAGTGALAIEAISRGASVAVVVDADRAAHKTIVQNAKTLGIDTVVWAHCMNIRSWVRDNSAQVFDIIFADPPYDDVKPDAIAELAQVLAPEGILVVSLPPAAPDLLLPETLELALHKSYGDAQLWFYKKG